MRGPDRPPTSGKEVARTPDGRARIRIANSGSPHPPRIRAFAPPVRGFDPPVRLLPTTREPLPSLITARAPIVGPFRWRNPRSPPSAPRPSALGGAHGHLPGQPRFKSTATALPCLSPQDSPSARPAAHPTKEKGEALGPGTRFGQRLPEGNRTANLLGLPAPSGRCFPINRAVRTPAPARHQRRR